MSGENANGGGEKTDKRRYNYMENVLQHIIQKISVNEAERKRNNQILNSAIEIMLAKMRDTSPLFGKLYTRIFYGGSYYDNLKTGKPDEYDIDLLMMLSKKQMFTLKPIETAPGFVTLQMADKNDSTEFAELFDGEFLCTDKVLKWMESLVSKTLSNLPTSGSQNILRIQDTDFFIKITKSGPAFTIRLNGQLGDTHMNFDVDLVPCFIFNAAMWPKGKFRTNPVQDKTDFFIVPKQPRGKLDCKMNHCWRLSFQEQERQLIRSCRVLKPCVKLMKKLRDHMNHKAISSYFIKTMFIWQIENAGKTFFDNSLSYVFVEMLQVYEKHLAERKIQYYWNTDNNLIGSLSDIMLDNYCNQVRRIVKDIVTKEENNPYYVGKFFLNKEEMEQLKVDVPLPVRPTGKEVKENGGNANGGASSDKSNGSNASNTKCSCSAANNFESALADIRREVAEARRDQEALKMDIMDLLQVVVKRLDNIQAKLA
ncbi:cyclic GMP-AMP synthase-like receptor isoform X1 [Atheta coriaria]|uniref:cyclic GMP-AMP synthase-like receptor isoform X1 n=1 Tax=Dalotia coriaria TaxID=877792 RepID=UPI0031F3BC3E